MGFKLFTASGTFNPIDYGLSPGDIIHIKCVGGGGGGTRANTATAGGAGGASSFGSVLTAAGGIGGLNTYVEPPKGSNAGGYGAVVYIGSTNYYCQGTGGDGWMPGYVGASGLPAVLYLPFTAYVNSSNAFNIYPGFNTSMNAQCTLYGRKIGYSYTSTVVSSGTSESPIHGRPGNVYGYNSAGNNINSLSSGGVGYGAGGGNGYYSYGTSVVGFGASSGVIADADYVLPNANAIAVTVGAGGTGYSTGGGGAHGCVAVWW